MIAVLGGLADVERDLIRTRTAEGRSRAQKRGQHMGRPSKLTDVQKAEARRRRAEGATLAELARSYHVGKSTISGSRGDREKDSLRVGLRTLSNAPTASSGPAEAMASVLILLLVCFVGWLVRTVRTGIPAPIRVILERNYLIVVVYPF
jgi:hypothetical protein